MRTPAVQGFCQALWDRRAEGSYLDGEGMSRTLAVAIVEDVGTVEKYVPARDTRVEWARQVIARALDGHRGMQAVADESTEACVALLLGRLEEAGPGSGEEMPAWMLPAGSRGHFPPGAVREGPGVREG